MPVRSSSDPPRGERWLGSVSAVKARAPVLGGNFGIWGGLFTTYDCSVKAVRQKEDPWNAIIAGFCTGSTLAVRGMLFLLRCMADVQAVPRLRLAPV